jgi:hypothetical protein
LVSALYKAWLDHVVLIFRDQMTLPLSFIHW